MICCHNNYITPEIMWPFKHAKNADKLKCEFVDFYYFFDRFSLLILFALTKFLFMFILHFCYGGIADCASTSSNLNDKYHEINE
ncbi:hypothetical protein RhiirA5_440560 [Rhizophagus irregularis]|uniref:Uncharacterized protein n=1 Tax=Rhizophagus irregularis TaxID=588596 RepID=A0A2N0NGJ0_9GLOM|nr:hypothetical protein RhiirA5_440560 [Rhizophagus irregularis]